MWVNEIQTSGHILLIKGSEVTEIIEILQKKKQTKYRKEKTAVFKVNNK